METLAKKKSSLFLSYLYWCFCIHEIGMIFFFLVLYSNPFWEYTYYEVPTD